MTVTTIAAPVGGLVLLIGGAELLVRGASRLALAAGIPPVVVGLTVVAFGTSAPEVVVTVGSSLAGQADVALGNVVGSNIFNVLFILGLSALITPLAVNARLVRIDVPVMIGVSVVVLLLALDGRVSRGEGLGLLAGLAAYTFLSVRHAGGEAGDGPGASTSAPSGRPQRRWPRQVGWVLAGLGLLVAGAWLLVDAAVALAQALGVGELVIGLTIVAAGTSLPEVATSVVAAARGHRDIAVANVVGSNIFNLLVVLGLGSVVASDGLSVAAGALSFDLPVMVAVAIATLPIAYTGYSLARWEGAVYLGYYVAYTGYLVLDAGGHAASQSLAAAIGFFILPLTVLTLGISLHRAWRARRQDPAALDP